MYHYVLAFYAIIMVTGAMIIPNIQMGSLRLGEVGDVPVVPAGRRWRWSRDISVARLTPYSVATTQDRQRWWGRQVADARLVLRGILGGDIQASREARDTVLARRECELRRWGWAHFRGGDG